jgi:hypothetical protein
VLSLDPSYSVAESPDRVDSAQLIGGVPVVCRSDGAAFGYSAALGAWVALVEPVLGSEFVQLRADVSSRVAGPLAGLAARLPRPSIVTVSGMDGRAAAGATIAHLESQLLAARLLQSAAEQREWTQAYAGHLAAASDERRLRALCSELFGTPSAPGDRALLRLVLRNATQAQRVVAEFLHQLESADAV